MEEQQILLVNDNCNDIWKQAISENRLKDSMDIGEPYFKLLESTLIQVIVYKPQKNNLITDDLTILTVNLKEKTELRIELNGVEYSLFKLQTTKIMQNIGAPIERRRIEFQPIGEKWLVKSSASNMHLNTFLDNKIYNMGVKESRSRITLAIEGIVKTAFDKVKAHV